MYQPHLHTLHFRCFLHMHPQLRHPGIIQSIFQDPQVSCLTEAQRYLSFITSISNHHYCVKLLLTRFSFHKMFSFLCKSTIDILCENAFVQSQMLRKSTSSSMVFPSSVSHYTPSDHLSRSRFKRADSPPVSHQARSQSAMSQTSFGRKMTTDNRHYYKGLPSYLLRGRLESFSYREDRQQSSIRYSYCYDWRVSIILEYFGIISNTRLITFNVMYEIIRQFSSIGYAASTPYCSRPSSPFRSTSTGNRFF